MRVPPPYKQTKNKINATSEITAGLCYREYVEIERSAQMVKIRHFLTFLPVRSSENDNDHPHLVV